MVGVVVVLLQFSPEYSYDINLILMERQIFTLLSRMTNDLPSMPPHTDSEAEDLRAKAPRDRAIKLNALTNYYP